MKKKILVGAAVVAMALGLASAPGLAGRVVPQSGTVVVDPDPVVQGGSTLIANADDDDSTCEESFAAVPAGGPAITSELWLDVQDPEGEWIAEEVLIPDSEGNWSLELTNLTTLGEYTVYAECRAPEAQINGFEPAETPDFAYAVATFEVIAQPTPQAPAPAPEPPAPGTPPAPALPVTPTYTG